MPLPEKKLSGKCKRQAKHKRGSLFDFRKVYMGVPSPNKMTKYYGTSAPSFRPDLSR